MKSSNVSRKKSRCSPSRLWLLLLTLSLPAGADVQVRLAQGGITQYQPFQVIFESQGTGSAQPDLSPLRQDFDIAGQQFSSSSRTVSGYTTRRHTVTLSLVPKRSGDLVIPPISFGQEESRALPIKVTPGTPPDSAGGTRGMPSNGAPFGQPQQDYSQSYSYSSGPNGQPPGWGNVPGWGGTPGFPNWSNGNPGMTGSQGWSPPPQGPTLTEAPTEAPTEASAEQSDAGYWPWIAGVALLGWLVTALALWRERGAPLPAWRLPSLPAWRPRPRPAKAVRETAAQPAAKVPPADPLAAIRTAYRSNDPFKAKDALLRWAGQLWPDDPPTNLSRLAVRCPTHLQRHVLRLEEALYSPSTMSWNEDPVWEELESVTRRERGETAEPAPPNS